MMVSANRFRSIGWLALLLVCAALVMVLAFRVNALRSQVHRTEQQIIALRKEKLYLETEVETRANQQQLKIWNDVEFGFVAPTASQYLSSERQLAAFAKPDEPGAPVPIRVASADNVVAAEAAFPAMIAQLAGDPGISARDATALSKAEAADNAGRVAPAASAADHAAAAASLGARLATVGPVKRGSAADAKPGLAKSRVAKAEPEHSRKDEETGRSGKSAGLASNTTSALKSGGKPAGKAATKPAASKASPSKPGKPAR